MIVAGRLIANRRFYIGANLMLVYRISSNIRVVVKGKIIEASTRTKIGDAEEILMKVLPSRVRNANDTANGAGSNKMVSVGGPKKKVCILRILLVIIDSSRYIINRCI